MPDRCCNCIERPDRRGTLQPIVVAVLPGTHTILGRFLGLVALFLAVQVGVAIALPRLHRMPEYVVRVSNPPAWVALYGVHDYVKVTNTMPRTLRLSCRVVGRADGSGFFPPGRYGDTERFLLRPFATHDWMELGIRITRIDCK